MSIVRSVSSGLGRKSQRQKAMMVRRWSEVTLLRNFSRWLKLQKMSCPRPTKTSRRKIRNTSRRSRRNGKMKNRSSRKNAWKNKNWRRNWKISCLWRSRRMYLMECMMMSSIRRRRGLRRKGKISKTTSRRKVKKMRRTRLRRNQEKCVATLTSLT